MIDQACSERLRPGIFFHGYEGSALRDLDILDVRGDLPPVVELKNVLCVPPYCVLFDETGNRITITGRSYRPPELYSARQYEVLMAKLTRKEPLRIDVPADPEIIDHPVFFAGMFISHFGHFLTDGLSRLWCPQLLKSHDQFYFQGLNQDIAENHGFSRTIMLHGSLDLSRRRHVKGPVKFRRLTVPMPSIQNDRRIYTTHSGFHIAAARALIGAGDGSTESVYLSRSALAPEHRGADNEAQLETALAGHGVRIVHPQSLAIVDQIRLFNGRRKIVSCSGSALHAMLFSICRGEGATLVNLTLPFVDLRYPLIDAILSQESHYLNACTLLPGETKSRGRFMIDIDRAVEFLFERKFF